MANDAVVHVVGHLPAQDAGPEACETKGVGRIEAERAKVRSHEAGDARRSPDGHATRYDPGQVGCGAGVVRPGGPRTRPSALSGRRCKQAQGAGPLDGLGASVCSQLGVEMEHV